jgi:peptide/nickel transport system substrate-binding protein
MNMEVNQDVTSFDPYNSETLFYIDSAWMERLFANIWTMDPSVFSYAIQFRSSDYVGGQLAQSWEFTDPSTFVVNLNQNVYWQDIYPTNGRQFTSADVVFHYDRAYGLGDGFTTPAPSESTLAAYKQLISVTATDKYTVVFKWAIPNPEFIMENLMQVSTSAHCEENSDAVQLWGNLNDWHHAIGTGPFILTDFVDSTSATLERNPDYWGYDERYPQNQLPYIDKLNILIIANSPTALAAMRVGKLDAIGSAAFTDAQNMAKTNPNILQVNAPNLNSPTIDPRNDLAPYNDVRVREALQMAIDLPTIAKTYYGGTASPYPSTMTSNFLTGWGFPYSQWPASLQAQYAYNPTQAKQLLAAAGYPNGFNTDLVVDSAVDINLVEIFQSYFAAIGVNMSITQMLSASWSSYVMTNHKNDALAMRTSGNLGFTFEPFTQLQRYIPGTSTNYMMVNDPVFNAFYPAALAASTSDAVKAIVQQANQYVAQQHFVISLIQYNNFCLYQPWVKGYTGQLYGFYVTSSGLPMLSFYQARFWIDQNAK